MLDILQNDPPHPPNPSTKNAPKMYPNELSRFQGINFLLTTSEDEIYSCFQNIIAYLNREPLDSCFKITKFVLISLNENLFQLFLRSKLCEFVSMVLEKICRELRIEAVYQTDDILRDFLRKNITKVIQSIDDPLFLPLQNFISLANVKLRHSSDLLRAIHASIRLSNWNRLSSKDGYTLQLILSSVFPARINELPDLLATEIARCLVEASLMLSTVKNYDMSEIKNLIISSIARFLKYKPAAFANPSTVFCLNEISAIKNRVTALPLCYVRNHPELISFPALYQLIKIVIFAIGTFDPSKLLSIAATCPAAQSEILSHHPDLLLSNPKCVDFFKQTVAIDTASSYIRYEEVPPLDDMQNLSIFLRSKSNEEAKANVYIRDLNQVITSIYKTMDSLPFASADIHTLISCSSVICSVISFEQNIYQNNSKKIEGYEPLSFHFFEAAIKIAEKMIASPLFPHYPCDNYIGTILKASFDELAGVLATRPKEFLTYLLNVGPNPAKVMLFTAGLRAPIVVEQFHCVWKNYVLVNIGDILKMGLSLLKIPTNITAGTIVVDFYLNLLDFAMKMSFPNNILYGILIAPFNLFMSVAEIAMETEEITNPKTIVGFLGFIEKILDFPVVKSFFLVNATDSFWSYITFFISPQIIEISTSLAARIIKIITKMSDFGNSISINVSIGQRILVDTLHYNDMIEIIRILNNLTENLLPLAKPAEKGILSMALAELLLSWCFPTPIGLVMKENLEYEKVTGKIMSMAEDAGQPFKDVVNSILSKVTECIQNIEGELDSFVEMEQNIPRNNPSQKLNNMLFKIIAGPR